MIKRKAETGFNLAFLDVMSCGLGAVILIFMLVKFHAGDPKPNVEQERLQAELAAVKQAQQALQQAQADVNQAIEQQQGQLQSTEQQTQAIAAQTDAATLQLLQSQQAVDKVQQQIAESSANPPDFVPLSGKGQENYLLGLKIEGEHIGILFDHSASMTDYALVDIITNKVASNTDKRRAPKWRRSLRVFNWMLARVPEKSKLTVVAFNDTAKQVGPISTSGGNSVGLKNIAAEIGALVPENGTNLQAALTMMRSLAPNLTHLYVITDGLPTLGDPNAKFTRLSKCGSLFKKVTTITGECRKRLFNETIKSVPMIKTQINTVLLPLEGDPEAPQLYWNWSKRTGGLMLSPAPSWP